MLPLVWNKWNGGCEVLNAFGKNTFYSLVSVGACTQELAQVDLKSHSNTNLGRRDLISLGNVKCVNDLKRNIISLGICDSNSYTFNKFLVCCEKVV